MKLNLELIPQQSVGPFKFGSELDEYKSFSFIELPEEYDESVGWNVYTLDETDIRIYVEEGKIVSVACYEECIYEDKNIIGMGIDEFKQMIELEPDEIEPMETEDGLQDIYDFDPLSIMVLVKDKEIVGIDCSNDDDDDEDEEEDDEE